MENVEKSNDDNDGWEVPKSKKGKGNKKQDNTVKGESLIKRSSSLKLLIKLTKIMAKRIHANRKSSQRKR